MTVAPEAFADRIRGHYLEALLGADLDGARRILDDAVSAGVPIRAVCLDVLQPALHEVGAAVAVGILDARFPA
jgi:hypothetical protein